MAVPVQVATTAITAVGNLFTRAISAYENCKKMDVELAALRVKHEVASKYFELEKLKLQEERKNFDRICKQIETQLDTFKIDRSEYLKRQRHYQRQSDQILKAILNATADDAQLDRLRSLWEILQTKMENAAREENIAVLNFSASAKQLIDVNRPQISHGSQPQINFD